MEHDKELLGVPSISEMSKDKTLSHFLREDFQEEKYLKAVLRKGSDSNVAAAQVTKLGRILQSLDNDIQRIILDHQSELIQQVEGLTQLDVVLQTAHQTTNHLQSRHARVQSEVRTPLQVFEEGVNVLEACVAGENFLRFTAKFVVLMQQLQAEFPHLINDTLQPNERADHANAACLIQEIFALVENHDLEGIEVVERQLPLVTHASNTLRSLARTQLKDAMVQTNHTQIKSALQVFFHLECVAIEVHQVLATLQQDSHTIVHDALSVGIFTEGARGAKRQLNKAALWQNLETMFDKLKQQTTQASTLHVVLFRGIDPVTRQRFHDKYMSSGGRAVNTHYWHSLTELFRSELEHACEATPSVRQALVEDYPRLFRLCSVFALQVTTAEKLGSTLTEEDKNAMNDAIQGLRQEFLQHSANEMNEASKALCTTLACLAPTPVTGQPRTLVTPSDCSHHLNIYLSVLQRELKRAMDSSGEELAALIRKGVADSLTALATNIRNLIAKGSDAVQLTSIATSAQILNSQLFKVVWQLRTRLVQPAGGSKTAPPTKDVVDDAIGVLQTLSDDIVAPLFKAMFSATERAISLMHATEPMAFEPKSVLSATPPWLTEMQHLISHVRTNILSQFPEHGVREHKQRLVSRLIAMFMEIAALHESFAVPGGNRSNDIAQLQYHLNLLFPIQECGGVKEELGVFKTMVETNTTTFVATLSGWANSINSGNQKIADLPMPLRLGVLPVSVLVHHIIARGYPDLQQPFQLFGWDVATYLTRVRDGGDQVLWTYVETVLEQHKQLIASRGSAITTNKAPELLATLHQLLKQNPQQ